MFEVLLLLFPMHLRRDFQTQTIQPNKSRRVVLVVGFGPVGFHRGDVRVKVHFFFFRLIFGFASGPT